LPEISGTLAAADDLDLAVVSVASWAEGLSSVWEKCTPAQRQSGIDDGAIAEVSGRLFDAAGRDVTTIDDRVIAVSLDQLRRATTTVGVARGAERARAVRAACATKILDIAVIDRALADALLDEAGQGDPVVEEALLDGAATVGAAVHAPAKDESAADDSAKDLSAADEEQRCPRPAGTSPESTPRRRAASSSSPMPTPEPSCAPVRPRTRPAPRWIPSSGGPRCSRRSPPPGASTMWPRSASAASSTGSSPSTARDASSATRFCGTICAAMPPPAISSPRSGPRTSLPAPESCPSPRSPGQSCAGCARTNPTMRPGS